MTERAYRARPPRGAAKVARVVMLLGFAVAGGAGVAFFLLVVVGIAWAELDPVTWDAGAPDVMFEQGVGAAVIAFGVGLGVGAIAQGAYRVLYACQFAREADAEPNEIAAWPDRRYVVAGPFPGVLVYGVYFLVLDAIAIAASARVLGEKPDDPVARSAVLAALVLAFLMAGVMLLAGTVWTRSWAEATARVRAIWGHGRPSTAGLESRNGDLAPGAATLRRFVRRIAVAAGGAGVVAVVAFVIALKARRPCRRCDQNYYDAAGETAIDVLMTIALPFATFAVVVLVLSLIALWLASVVEWTAAERLARTGGAEPERNALARLLYGWWPGATAGVALVALGWGAAPVLAGAALAAPGILPDALVPALVALGLLGVVVVWWSVDAAARAHTRLREAWSLGDVVRPRPSRKGRRTR